MLQDLNLSSLVQDAKVLSISLYSDIKTQNTILKCFLFVFDYRCVMIHHTRWRIESMEGLDDRVRAVVGVVQSR